MPRLRLKSDFKPETNAQIILCKYEYYNDLDPSKEDA